jgi:hypothetical protein
MPLLSGEFFPSNSGQGEHRSSVSEEDDPCYSMISPMDGAILDEDY